ncbi:DUF4349 domain-containing protein [Aquimarina sp. 2201CG5-10]|uniref:DUF4349 domain-containing protein n=1 Tax=Aquimarina callyspongiae TaxID=3098150 RepID=UPI002AB47CF7|nr:DUF4349 domain-containing protein [Aquimarina sp. 2201CG5-10]MDY8134512.1 DUF4349 domain-containing protein [Aquimarina sp. 2201CG5-10]
MKTSKTHLVKTLLLLVIMVITFSCANEGNYDMKSERITLEETGETSVLNSYEVETEKTGNTKGSDQQKDNINSNLKIIRNATCRINVDNVEDATKIAKQIAGNYQGYVSDERFTNTNTTKENRFTIRIPQDKFDIVLDSICKLAAFVDYKNISTIDVTEEYVDISSRLKTKLEVKERYETILRTRAKTVEDILKAEDKLRKLQEEIESAQGRLNYLSNKVSYSTIQLDMYETVIPKKQPEKYEPKYVDKATKGLSFGWSFIENASLLLFYIWPLLLLGIIVLIYFKFIRK